MGHEVRLGRIADLDAFVHDLDKGRLHPEQVQFVTTMLQMAEAGQRAVLRRRFGRKSAFGIRGHRLCSLVEEWVGRSDEGASCVDLDRRYVRIEWTLAVLEPKHGSNGLANEAILGERPLVVKQSGARLEVLGGQGFKKRVSSKLQCERVAEFLGGIDSGDFAAAFDWPAMIAAGVYKAHHADRGEDALKWALRDFAAVSDFYRAVSNSGHAVLVTRD